MLSKEENELLTRVGPGTPAGEMLQALLVAGSVQRGGEAERRAGQSEIVGGRVRAVSRRRRTTRAGRASLFASRHFAGIRQRRRQSAFAAATTVGSMTCRQLFGAAGGAGRQHIQRTHSASRLSCSRKPAVLIFAYIGPEPAPLLPELRFARARRRLPRGRRRRGILQLAAARREFLRRRALHRVACGRLSQHGNEAADDEMGTDPIRHQRNHLDRRSVKAAHYPFRLSLACASLCGARR